MEKIKFEVADKDNRFGSHWIWFLYYPWKMLMYGSWHHILLLTIFMSLGLAATITGSGIFTVFMLIFLYLVGMLGFDPIVTPGKETATMHWMVTTSATGYIWGCIVYLFYTLYIFQYNLG